MESDVIVVGAGAAGLSAARDLARAGWHVRLIEARDRVGGRVFSVQPRGWTQPVELGAEFVHGGNRSIRAALKRARARLISVKVNMWRWEHNTLVPVPDYWETIGRVAGQIPRRNHAWSFRQFLRHHRGRIPAGDRALAASYVGSFNAAPLGKISAHALRDHRAGADTDDKKIAGRYDSVMRALQKEWPARQVDLRLNSVATEIFWRAGEVVVRTRSSRNGRKTSHTARAAVVTLPLGVLKARRVKFCPPLGEHQSLIDRAGWGDVVRIVIRFRTGFWSAPFMPRPLGARQGRGFGFVNAPGESVPVWWALTPPAPILTGWAGGEISDRIGRRSAREALEEASKSLAHIFRIRVRELKKWIADWVIHDWRKDPFSLGAYSYPVAGGEDIAALLAQPVKETLFFAGEALATDYGTVHGAIESGRDAARLADRMLKIHSVRKRTSARVSLS